LFCDSLVTSTRKKKIPSSSKKFFAAVETFSVEKIFRADKKNPATRFE